MTQPTPHWHRLALVATLTLVAAVLALLPWTTGSLLVELVGQPENTLYEVTADRSIVPVRPGRRPDAAVYASIVVAAVDEATRVATLRISGQRACTPTCPAEKLVFFSVQDDAAQRRALPASATLSVAQDVSLLNGSVQLPVRGRPTLYPFDTYQLWLAIVGSVTEPDGTERPVRPDDVDRNLQLTLQADLAHLNMAVPTWIDPARVQAEADPVDFLYVFGLTFQRPFYLKALAVLLVLLIAMSGCLAVFMRPVHDLFLGIGGVVLGVWGVRAVIVQGTLPYVTAVDLALSAVILLLLLGLAVRAALHFHRRSALHLPWTRRPR